MASFVGAAIAIFATCSTQTLVWAFDKPTCALAYERAQQLRFKQKLRLAREQLITCGHSSCPSVVTKDCTAWLEEVDLELASVLFRVKDTNNKDLTEIHISMDGEPLRDQLDGVAVWIEPGTHHFHFESEASGVADVYQTLQKTDRARAIEVVLKPRQADLPKREQVTTNQGEAGTTDGHAIEPSFDDKKVVNRPPIELQLTGPEPSRSMPGIETFVAAGIGVVALSTFAYLELKASSDAADMRHTCAPNCPAGDVDGVRGKLVAANVSLGVGVAALGVAGLLWALRPTSSPTTSSSSSLRFDVVPTVGQHGVEVLTTFSAP
jgi:hypothetical protein